VPNPVLIERLFGSTSSNNRTDLLIIDGERNGFSPQEEITKLNAILQSCPFPQFYLCKVDSEDYVHHFKEYLIKGNFTTLGLEGVTKEALRKIMNSLPDTVTKIGIDKLTPKGVVYLYWFLKKKIKRNLIIVCGNDIPQEYKERFEKLSEDVEPQTTEAKKRKSSTSNIILATIIPGASTKTTHKKPKTQMTADLIVDYVTSNKFLVAENRRLKEALSQVPDISELQKNLQEAQALNETLSDTVNHLNSEVTWAKNRIHTLETFRLKENDTVVHEPSSTSALLSSAPGSKPIKGYLSGPLSGDPNAPITGYPYVPETNSRSSWTCSNDLLSLPPGTYPRHRFDNSLISSPYSLFSPHSVIPTSQAPVVSSQAFPPSDEQAVYGVTNFFS
jgi:hypothetical protein